MKIIKLLCWLVLLNINSFFTIHAIASSYQMSEIIVTTSKAPRKLADVPIRTRVVTAKQLQQMHANKLEDSLIYIPGLQIRELHGKTGSGVWIQGLDSNRVLILVDGNPIIPTIGSSVDVSQIAIGDIERIEIIKGALSSLYGTSAMGGVINIITKQPKYKFKSSANLSSGNWLEQSQQDNPLAKNSVSVDLSTKREKWYAQFIANILNSKGFKVNQRSNKTDGWHGYKHNFSGKVQYKFANRFKVTASPRFYDEDVRAINETFIPGNGIVTRSYKDVTKKWHLSVVAEQSLQHIDWKLRSSVENYQHKSFKANNRNTSAQHRDIAVELLSELGDSHLLTYGMQYTQDFLDSKNLSSGQHEVPNKSKKAYEAFVQYSWLIDAEGELSTGLRFDRNDRDGQHFAPSINSIYKIRVGSDNVVNLRLGIANGYRTPNLKELHYIFDHSAIGYMVLGNKKLKAESSLSIQFSAEWVYKNAADYEQIFEINVFKNNIKNLIETAFRHSKNRIAVYDYQNIAKAQTQGIELTFSQRPYENLQWDLNYVYLDAKDLSTNKYLPKRPKHEVKMGIEYAWSEDTNFMAKYRYESDQFVDTGNNKISKNFSVIDLKLNQAIGSNWSWYVGINNLTGIQRDFKFEDTDFRPAQNRFVYLGVDWKHIVP